MLYSLQLDNLVIIYYIYIYVTRMQSTKSVFKLLHFTGICVMQCSLEDRELLFMCACSVKLMKWSQNFKQPAMFKCLFMSSLQSWYAMQYGQCSCNWNKQHQFQFSLSIVIEDAVTTCMYVTMTLICTKYKLHYVLVGLQTFLMGRYYIYFSINYTNL